MASAADLDEVVGAMNPTPPRLTGQVFLNSENVRVGEPIRGTLRVEMDRSLRQNEEVLLEVVVFPYTDMVVENEMQDPTYTAASRYIWASGWPTLQLGLERIARNRQGIYFTSLEGPSDAGGAVVLRAPEAGFAEGVYQILVRATFRYCFRDVAVWEVGSAFARLVSGNTQAGPAQHDPQVTGKLTLNPSTAEPGAPIHGELGLHVSDATAPVDAVVSLSIRPSRLPPPAPGSFGTGEAGVELQWPGLKNGTYLVYLAEDLPLCAKEDGDYVVTARVQWCSHSATPNPANGSPVATADLKVVTNRFLRFVSAQMQGPRTIEAGGDGEFVLRYRARGLKGKITEDLSVFCSNTPAGRPAQWTPVGTASHQSAVDRVMSDEGYSFPCRLSGLGAGRYRVECTVRHPDAPEAKGEGSFEVVTKKPAPQPAGPVYVLVGIQDDWDKLTGRTGNGVRWTSVTRAGATAVAQESPTTRLSLRVGGSPPEELRPGVKFDMTITASGEAKDEDAFSVDGGLAVSGIKVTAEPKNQNRDRVSAYAARVNNQFVKVPTATMTYHCEVTKESLESVGDGDVTIQPFWGGGGSLAVYLYKRMDPGGVSSTPPAVTLQPLPDPPKKYQITARLLKESITLVPGEMDEHCGVYIGGFRNNTEDQVEIRIPIIVGGWGSLRQNKDIQVDNGEWNEAPDYMYGDMYGDEHYVLLTWRAKVTARPASEVVPITVRQRGAGEVTLRLRVNIAAKRVYPQPAGGAALPLRRPPRPPVMVNQTMSYDQRYRMALSLLERKEYRKAQDVLVPLVKEQPNKAAYHYALGRAWEGQEKWSEAAASYGEAVRLEDTNVEYRVRLGNAMLALGRPAEAEQVYREGIRLSPAVAILHLGLGGALARQQRWADAEAPHRQAVSLEPANPQHHFFLAIDFAYQGKAEQEAASMAEAVRLDPANALYRDALGTAFFRLARWAESEDSYRRAIGLDASNGTFHANLAGVLLKQMRRDEALQEAETARRLGCPSHPVFQELGLPSAAPAR
jgi:Tfp pilus assembly protein PilF